MIRVEKSVDIAVRPETAFDFMDDAHHQADISPSLSEVFDVDRAATGGVRAGFVYKMAGVPLRGEVEAVEFVRPERIVFDMRGPLDGRIWFLFAPVGEGVRVTYGADYELPGAALERLTRPLLVAYNERELSATLANLKDRLEAGAA